MVLVALAMCGTLSSLAGAAPIKSDFFGVTSFSQLANEEEVAAISELGLRNIRNNVNWNQVQTSDCNDAGVSGLDWEFLDAKFENAAWYGITIIADLYGNRKEGAGCAAHEFPMPGESAYDAFIRPGGFVWQAVQRYGYQGRFWRERWWLPYHPVRVWEVWNEPNRDINNPGGRVVQPQNYARLLIDTARAIRNAQSQLQSLSSTNTKVLMGGLGPSTQHGEFHSIACPSGPVDYDACYLHTMYAISGSGASYYTNGELHNAFDGLSYHPYQLAGDATDVQAEIQLARDVLDEDDGANSDTEKTIWVTEAGWGIVDIPAQGDAAAVNVTEQEQAEYLRAAFRWAYNNAEALNLKYMAWFVYQDLDEATCTVWSCWERVAGLKRSDGSERPAWCGYSHLIGSNLCLYVPPGGFTTDTFATITQIQHGAPGSVSVNGQVYVTNMEGQATNDVYVNVNFQKWENEEWVTKSTAHPVVVNNYYEVRNWSVGIGRWRTRTVLPTQGDYNESASGYHGFDITTIPTQTFLTLDRVANGTPGTASVHGNVQRLDGTPISGTVNVNFQKLVNNVWTTMSTAQRTLSNGYYEVLNWGVGIGHWRVRAVFAQQNGYLQSESNYHEFDIQPVATQTFLTFDEALHGQPGYASVHGNVLRNGTPVSGTVNVNFQKLVNNAWTTMSTAVRTLSNGSYDVDYWGVGVGQWRVRAVFPQQGEYAQSESNYHYFEIKSGYRLIARHSGKCMSLSANNAANGTGIIQWDCSGNPVPWDGQVFTLVPMGGGDFRLVINSTGKCVDVTGWSTADGAWLQEWDCLGTQGNQLWQVIPIAGQPPYVAFRSKHSGKCADVLGISQGNGARVGQWGCHWGGNQQWSFQAIN